MIDLVAQDALTAAIWDRLMMRRSDSLIKSAGGRSCLPRPTCATI